jgi:predicted nucleic acid-binding protein
MQPHTAEAALYALDSVVSARYPHGVLATAAWRLRHDLSYYDALYVALASRLGYPLLTADARLANAPGLPCAVELVT